MLLVGGVLFPGLLHQRAVHNDRFAMTDSELVKAVGKSECNLNGEAAYTNQINHVGQEKTMNDNLIGRFFSVYIQPKTYLNLLYLLLSFPLGLAYFVLIVTGLSVGFGTLIIWVGLVVLVAMFAIIWGLTAWERQQAIWLLKVEIPPMSRQQPEGLSIWQRAKAYLSNPVTWKGLLFLLLKFPIGVASFVMLTTGLSISLAMIAAPVVYRFIPYTIDISVGEYFIDSSVKAVLVFLAGIPILTVSLHIYNITAELCGKLAMVMLGIRPAVVAVAAEIPQAKAEGTAA
jgi:hypothetical protein